MSCILGFHQDGQVWKNNAKIVIYDDETGKMVKSVDLDIDIAAVSHPYSLIISNTSLFVKQTQKNYSL